MNLVRAPLFPRLQSLQHHPLGSTFTSDTHSVISSLPTLDAVIGYEEKRPDVIDALTQGYPRFVRHALVRQACAEVAAANAWDNAYVCLVTNPDAAQRLCEFSGKRIGLQDAEAFTAVAFKPHSLSADRARAFLQHTGTQISSRQAEDWLSGRQNVGRSYASEAAITQALLPWLRGATERDVTLACGGANAFYAAYEAISAVQATRGRDVWVQLGWLYVDSGMVLDRFASDEAPVQRIRLGGLDALAAFLVAHGSRVAGIACEAPSNPLLETPDLERLAELARAHGALLLIDPTVSSLVNVEALPFADVLVCSLTKYAARGADVLAGCVVVNSQSREAAALREHIRAIASPLYARDAERLAEEIQQMPAFVGQVNANALALAAYLDAHPCASNVRHALQPACRDAYRRIARGDTGPGALLSFSVKGSLRAFFDALAVPKAASFGAEFTIASPFLYLAHYDLVSTPDGRAGLVAQGIDPDLIRVSVGAEPIDALIATFERAFAQVA